ncbi:MAG TPA: DUF1007 family protein, partial [Bradyrhizobium sp.]
MKCLIGWLALAVSVVLGTAAAEAHPHVWIVAKSELIYAPDGTITGVRHAWTFDDMFSTYALQGIETKVKGAYSREELAPLAQTLRYKLGLTGTKLGCDRAECGACTVLIDDVPHYACSVLTHTVRTKKIVTIEGLASDDGAGNLKLHPVQQGVVDEQGFQCAFCMSGFIMATVGFLKINPNPSRTELAHG